MRAERATDGSVLEAPGSQEDLLAVKLAVKLNTDGSVAIRRKPGKKYEAYFEQVPLVSVAKDMRHMPDAFIGDAANDVTEAFLEYAKALPSNCIFLVDTYATLSGIDHADLDKNLILERVAECAGDGEMLALLDKEQKEIDVFKTDPASCCSVFFVMRKR